MAEHLGLNESALETFRAAFSPLPQLAWLDSDTRASLHAIQAAHDLPANASAVALLLDRTEEAVEFLGAGRSFIWSQAAQLRTPVDDVEASSTGGAELASKLRMLSKRLEGGIADNYPRGSPASMSTTERQIRQESLYVIEDIRKLPGFYHFMEQESYQSIAAVSQGEPVVILIAHARLSVALVLTSPDAQPACIQLNVSVATLETLHSQLRYATQSRGGISILDKIK